MFVWHLPFGRFYPREIDCKHGIRHETRRQLTEIAMHETFYGVSSLESEVFTLKLN